MAFRIRKKRKGSQKVKCGKQGSPRDEKEELEDLAKKGLNNSRFRLTRTQNTGSLTDHVWLPRTFCY